MPAFSCSLNSSRARSASCCTNASFTSMFSKIINSKSQTPNSKSQIQNCRTSACVNGSLPIVQGYPPFAIWNLGLGIWNFLILTPIMATGKEIVVSGIRSTGFLHLGNYFGAIRNYIRMQEDYDCYFFVADWHSLTTHPDSKDLRGNVFRVLAENIASGMDPEKVALYAQSDVPEIAELYLLLNMLAYKGELEKVPTFKDKVRLQPQNVNAGLLTYPVLMSADILV